MKKVIIEFDADEQAETFFGIFSDIHIEDIETEEVVKDAFNQIMYNCGVDTVDTIKNDDAYSIKCR